MLLTDYYKFVFSKWVAEAGTTRHLDWPPWAQVLIAFLVLISALWIPGVALARCTVSN